MVLRTFILYYLCANVVDVFLKLRREDYTLDQSSLSRAVAKAMAQQRPPVDTVLKRAAGLQV